MSPFNQRKTTKSFTNQDYRKWFMENSLPRFYNPILHVCFNIGLLLAVIIYHFSKIENYTFLSFLTMIIILPIGNLVVTLIHQYPLHKRLKVWPFPYDAHTVEHHRFYTSDHILITHTRELFVVMFPWFVILGFIIVAQPLFYFLFSFLINPDMGHIIAGSAAGYFLLYEFVHTSNHLPLNSLVFYIPGMKAMRKHHLIHHNPKLMGKYNMGIVFPFFDYIFGSKWKESQSPLPKDKISDHYNNLESFSN
jgi:hypothetical protein